VAHVFGWHGGQHRFGVPPPPQVWGGVQLPQSSIPPQPSLAGPQSNPIWPQVFGTQASLPASEPLDELLLDEADGQPVVEVAVLAVEEDDALDVAPAVEDDAEVLAEVVAPPPWPPAPEAFELTPGEVARPPEPVVLPP
jgi:hypothetical protein